MVGHVINALTLFIVHVHCEWFFFLHITTIALQFELNHTNSLLLKCIHTVVLFNLKPHLLLYE